MSYCLTLPVFSGGEDVFTICYQSPEDVKVPTLKETVTLVCLSSTHGLSTGCHYGWEKLGERATTYTNSPVIFVNQCGLYKCSVQFKARRLSSSIFNVSVELGKTTLKFLILISI